MCFARKLRRMSTGIPTSSFAILGALAGATVVSSYAAWWFWRRARNSAQKESTMLRRDAQADARSPALKAASCGAQGSASTDSNASPAPQFIRFDEATLDRVEQTFERLVAQGVLTAERTTEEALVLARVPAHAGPVFRSLAQRYRSVGLPEVGVCIMLHDGEIADDALGGWRLRAEPEELDIRISPSAGWPDAPGGDVIVDATWSPRSGSEVAQHSTILHFLVRAAVGDRL